MSLLAYAFFQYVTRWLPICRVDTSPESVAPDCAAYSGGSCFVRFLPRKNQSNPNAAKAATENKVAIDYTVASWLAFESALESALNMPETSQIEVDNKTIAIYGAISLLEAII